MSRRRPVWRPTDIRDWGSSPRPKNATITATPSPPTFDVDMDVQVRVGRETWTTKLRWVVDLLDDAEVSGLRIALSERCPFKVSARPGRAEMATIFAV
jgi:hypothetical protein